MSDARGRFLAALCAAAREIPAAVIDRVAQRLEALPSGAGAEDRLRVLSGVMQPQAREVLGPLLTLWAREMPEIAPASLAWALRAAEAADQAARREQRLELAWSGPSPGVPTLRRIDRALLQVIDGAQEQLLLVTFAAYRVPLLREALLRAGRRQVRIDIVAESERESEGRLSKDMLEALQAVATVYVWPRERRPRDEDGNAGVLHTKCAIADRRTLLVSSANLTAMALTLNMEMGVLIDGGELPYLAARHFEGLMAAGVLTPVPSM